MEWKLVVRIKSLDFLLSPEREDILLLSSKVAEVMRDLGMQGYIYLNTVEEDISYAPY